MTSSFDRSGPPTSPPPRGPSLGLPAAVLLAMATGVVFWAGMTLGGGGAGRTAEERAAVEAFSETYRMITQRHIDSPSAEELLEGTIEGMFEVLDDPYSGYLPGDQFDSALDSVRGEFEGVGAELGTADEGGAACALIDDGCRLRVLEVLVGTPAEATGLQAGDVLVEVDGVPLEGQTLGDAVRLIRGPRGSEVTLSLIRDGQEQELVITRDTVLSEDVRSAVLADGQVGYLAIESFSPRVAGDLASALQEHLDAGIDRLVLDLRDDPGGFVDATVEIADLFLDGGPVFWEEDAGGRQVSVDAEAGGMASDDELEVAVLVNSGTASASEILAGALQDAGRAWLVGERTFGKGTVQEWTQLPSDSGGFRLSVAKWLTRDKTWIDGVGLLPDLPVAGTGTRYRGGVAGADPDLDDQLQAAVTLLLDEAPDVRASAPPASSLGSAVDPPPPA